MTMQSIGRHLSVCKIESTDPRQTIKRFEVFRQKELVGLVTWYSQWRQYCFWPDASTPWSRNDLDDIGAFLASVTNERKKGTTQES